MVDLTKRRIGVNVSIGVLPVGIFHDSHIWGAGRFAEGF